MFLFRSRRGNLVKKLWKLQCRDDKQGQAQDDRRNVATAMLKRLKEPALEGLVRAVENKGADTGSCCLVPKGNLRLGRHTVSPHVLCCQLFRWSDLAQEQELIRLPLCTMSFENDQLYTCCNPYHWARIPPKTGEVLVYLNLQTISSDLKKNSLSSVFHILSPNFSFGLCNVYFLLRSKSGHLGKGSGSKSYEETLLNPHHDPGQHFRRVVTFSLTINRQSNLQTIHSLPTKEQKE